MFKKVTAWRSKKETNIQSVRPLSSVTSSSSEPSHSLSYPSSDVVRESADTDAGPLGLNVVYTPDNSHKADIVFIHGLGGTSRWTWSKNRDPELFWPLTFLPLEPDLCLARILTFGYNASLRKSSSVATSVLDFAKDLLFDLKYAKDRNLEDLAMGRVPLIFVVHSMGGLIVKEAYMQGQHDPEYEAIIKAVCAITFIATPHRGTNLAQTLNRILDSTVVTNSKQYITDLVNNSLTLQKLNEQFRHIAPKLDIVSFYETLPTSIGIKSARVMVLEKETSVLGYPGEVSKALNADHHGVCKYEGPQDPNYITMRNILKSLMSKIISKNNATRPELSDRRASLHLKQQLALPELPNTDYIIFRDRWTQGTNDWINHDKTYLEWRNERHQKPGILWLVGDAATGKSVLSSFVVNSLIEESYQCQYFFIRYGDRLKRTISLLLRSIAFQMAQTLPGLMEKMTHLVEEALDLESADPRIIWERVFKFLVFKSDLHTPVYWVIDGLDENEDPRGLVRLLFDISTSFPIRIFITSRQTSEIASAFQRPPRHVKLVTIEFEGHLEDLRHHVQSELRIAGTEDFRRDVEDRIIKRSQNNFLWVRLAVDRVNQCHVSTDVDAALEDFPIGMEALYNRMAASVTELQNSRDRALAVRILQCVSCALRPLSVHELSQTLGDDAQHVLDLPRAIIDICGGFIVIDHDGNVAIIHQTARDYLLHGSGMGRPLNVYPEEAHKQLFLDTMKCLMSDNLRIGLARPQRPVFVDYASEFWSIHLLHVSHDDRECAMVLRKFLEGRCALTWIHALASGGKLRAMIQASRNLSRYASKRARRDTGAGIFEQEFLDNWAVDMLRIPGKFGHILRRKPDSIYTFIPPFCPKSSPVYQQFGKQDGLAINGLSTEKWDDSLARMHVGNSIMSSIEAAGPMVALLNSTGSVSCYDSLDFRQLPTSPFDHCERVMKMQLNNNASLLATYGYRTLKIWKIASGECILTVTSIESKTKPLSMLFSENDTTLMVGTDDKRIRSLALDEPEPEWRIVAELEEDEIEDQYTNSASNMALSRDGTMVAVAYRRYPVSAWELDGPLHIGLCRRTNEDTAIREVRDIRWHPHNSKLFGLNFEGNVFKWAPFNDVVEEVPTGATKFCLSRDGELLATGDGHGRIKLYTTAGFAFLYQLVSQDAVFGLSFSPDSRRLYDIRGYQGNAWEPSALVKFKAKSDAMADSPSEYNASLSTGMSLANLGAVDPVTALAECPNSDLFCSGSARGVVSIHDTRHGKITTAYTSRAKFSISQIVWSSDGKLLCFTDVTKQITLMSVTSASDKADLEVDQVAVIPMRKYASTPISQLLFQPNGNRVLVCVSSKIHSVSLKTFSVENTAEITDNLVHQWMIHPGESSLILGLGPSSLVVLDWNLKEVSKGLLSPEPQDSIAQSDEGTSFSIDRVIPSHDNKHILLQLVHAKQSSRNKFLFLGTDAIPIRKALQDENEDHVFTIQLKHIDAEVSSHIMTALSFLKGDRLVFISKSFSVCSVRFSWTTSGDETSSLSKPLPQGQGLRPPVLHRRRSSIGDAGILKELFALPGDWISQDCLAICKVVLPEKTFLCPHNGDVAMVRCSALA
ncbi:hypothetical protein F5Y16DRAFT_35563 [Xylariaceae sp. FL0255]|nr:hypothetical protein F5Y16DRAFT_35563 [Xylariaceae sp. FL0255]